MSSSLLYVVATARRLYPLAFAICSFAASCGSSQSADGAAPLQADPTPIEPLPGIDRADLANLVLPTPKAASLQSFGTVPYYSDMQPASADPAHPAVVLVPARMRGRLWDAGLEYASLAGDSIAITRNLDGKQYFVASAVGRSSAEGRVNDRIVTVLTGDKFDERSFVNWFAPWPRTAGVTVEARGALANAAVTHSRRLLDGYGQTANIFAIGDCNGDRDDDFFLLAKDHNDGVLLSGRDLETLGALKLGRGPGTASCKLPDLDGDGIDEVFTTLGAFPDHVKENGELTHVPDFQFVSQHYAVLSPGKRAVLMEGQIQRPVAELRYVWSAAWAGRSAAGQPRIAWLTTDGEHTRLLVIDASSGDVCESIEAPGGSPASHGRPVSGAFPGDDSRRWIAWSLQRIDYGPSRLFVAELGVADSTIEVALPEDGRNYGGCLCQVSLNDSGGSQRDGLAISVAAGEESVALPDFRPVLFLDIARLFERR